MEFNFLNKSKQLTIPRDWNSPDVEKLWLYNLHYFDDLNAKNSKARLDWQCDYIARWIDENPAPAGNGWEPYPISLRVVNWIKWAMSGVNLKPHWRDSLALQLRVLEQQIEWDLLGNHLLANAKALIFGGIYFTGSDADRWLRLGLDILEEQLPEQILQDGGHFELSPMYHALITEDVLDLINLVSTFGIPKDPQNLSTRLVRSYHEWRETASRMLRWLALLSHPDGDIAFFNDAAFAIAPRSSDLEAYAEALDVKRPLNSLDEAFTPLVDTGYFRLAQENAVCILDAALVGPDYQPGHAHADTLSFELSVFGHRVIVNGGTSQYGTGEQRHRERGTAAHSTVEINGENSSEVWSGFRVARRARPVDLSYFETATHFELSCAHDGYRRLRGKPVHRREWNWAAGKLTVKDTIEGSFEHAIARYHLHPSVKLKQIDELSGVLVFGADESIKWSVSNCDLVITESKWHPEFGKSIPNQCLELHFRGPAVSLQLNWNGD